MRFTKQTLICTFTIIFVGAAGIVVGDKINTHKSTMLSETKGLSMPQINIKQRAQDYLDFMARVGNDASDAGYTSALPGLFSENLKKIENGKLIVQGHDELSQQLKTAREYAFPWSIEVLDVLADTQKHSAAVRFTWNSEKMGLHITTTILDFDETGKITHIKEVYNKHSDITH